MELYVIRRVAMPDKGHEIWTDDPADADDLFTVIAVAGRPRPAAEGSAFAKAMPETMLATSQAIVYNANPQEPHKVRIDLLTKRTTPWHQPKTGWDTLQWEVRDAWLPTANRSKYDNGMPYELIGSGKLLKPDYPVVHVAWYAKLVGVSAARMEDMALASGRPALAKALKLSAPHYEKLLTH